MRFLRQIGAVAAIVMASANSFAMQLSHVQCQRLLRYSENGDLLDEDRLLAAFRPENVDPLNVQTLSSKGVYLLPTTAGSNVVLRAPRKLYQGPLASIVDLKFERFASELFRNIKGVRSPAVSPLTAEEIEQLNNSLRQIPEPIKIANISAHFPLENFALQLGQLTGGKLRSHLANIILRAGIDIQDHDQLNKSWDHLPVQGRWAVLHDLSYIFPKLDPVVGLENGIVFVAETLLESRAEIDDAQALHDYGWNHFPKRLKQQFADIWAVGGVALAIHDVSAENMIVDSDKKVLMAVDLAARSGEFTEAYVSEAEQMISPTSGISMSPWFYSAIKESVSEDVRRQLLGVTVTKLMRYAETANFPLTQEQARAVVERIHRHFR